LPLSGLLESITSNEPLLWTLGVISLVTFCASLLIIPWLVVRIPVDYFAEKKRHFVSFRDHHPVLRIILLVLKNLAGVVFIILGVGMLVLPGQGLLTILLGIIFLNFPGKYRLERWFIRLRHVHRAVDWLRRRSGRKPLIFEQET
jgi:hypothetical protein